MDRAVGWDAEIAVELAQQQLADLARAPMGFSCLQRRMRLSICSGSWLA
jgi:hypothetical protein